MEKQRFFLGGVDKAWKHTEASTHRPLNVVQGVLCGPVIGVGDDHSLNNAVHLICQLELNTSILLSVSKNQKTHHGCT